MKPPCVCCALWRAHVFPFSLPLLPHQTFAEAERHHWESMEREWEKEKEKILNSLLGSAQELEFPIEPKVINLCTPPSSTHTHYTIHTLIMYTLHHVHTAPCTHCTMYTLYHVHTTPSTHSIMYTLHHPHTLSCTHYTTHTLSCTHCTTHTLSCTHCTIQTLYNTLLYFIF